MILGREIDFMGVRKIAAAISALLVVVSSVTAKPKPSVLRRYFSV